MLVLSRKKLESIVIGDMQIEITVVEIRGDKVKLGIVAPESIPVHRREVYEAIERDRVRKISGQ
jgi:carbon storage regulator